MSEPHCLSLRTRSDQVAVLAMMAVGGAGLFVVTPSFAFLSSAAVAGILFGVADWRHLFDKKWPRIAGIVVLVLSASTARDLCFPKLGLGVRAFASFQFIALAILVAMIVVQLGVRVEDRTKVG
jgi:hypothetical protein